MDKVNSNLKGVVILLLYGNIKGVCFDSEQPDQRVFDVVLCQAKCRLILFDRLRNWI